MSIKRIPNIRKSNALRNFCGQVESAFRNYIFGGIAATDYYIFWKKYFLKN